MLKAFCVLSEIAQVLCNADHRKCGSIRPPRDFQGALHLLTALKGFQWRTNQESQRPISLT